MEQVVFVRYINTVKPVYNDHPWDPQKVVVVERWSLFECGRWLRFDCSLLCTVTVLIYVLELLNLKKCLLLKILFDFRYNRVSLYILILNLERILFESKKCASHPFLFPCKSNQVLPPTDKSSNDAFFALCLTKSKRRETRCFCKRHFIVTFKLILR